MGDCVVKRVQVLLACYNGGPYLPRQLATLREQDDPCFSVLMQDDGSSDDTASLLRGVAGRTSAFTWPGKTDGTWGLSEISGAFCDNPTGS